jgi:hypothetical protein
MESLSSEEVYRMLFPRRLHFAVALDDGALVFVTALGEESARTLVRHAGASVVAVHVIAEVSA